MPRGQVRNRLLTTARALCARDGVGAVSIRGVIGEAGANLNAVHYHFGSREALLDAVAESAMQHLNDERFRRFDRLEEDGLPASEEAGVRAVLEAGYEPLFQQALGVGRVERREGLLVVGQLRRDPLGARLPGLADHGERFVARIESLLGRAVRAPVTRLREGMRLVNAAAWDSALRPDVLARLEGSRAPRRALRRFTNGFLDFAAAGLLGQLRPSS